MLSMGVGNSFEMMANQDKLYPNLWAEDVSNARSGLGRVLLHACFLNDRDGRFGSRSASKENPRKQMVQICTVCGGQRPGTISTGSRGCLGENVRSLYSCLTILSKSACRSRSGWTFL
jgi:hypothetical protein